MRRREIEPADLGAVINLLSRGFPRRPRAYWTNGLGRLSARPAPDGFPRYGYLLEGETGPIGVLLTIHSLASAENGARVRCNLSSWFVEPAYRLQATQLVAWALKRPSVTFTNISPAPHTWPIIEAQGFELLAAGRTVMVPALSPVIDRALVSRWPDGGRDLPEAKLLDDHAGFGCLCLVVEARDGRHPFVLQPFRVWSGRLRPPLMQMIYCRDAADFVRFAGVLGRWLAGLGCLGVVLDGEAPPHAPPVLTRIARGRLYFKGPHPPRLGDLSYTERVVFGP